VNGGRTDAEVIVTMSPVGILFPSQLTWMHWSLSPESPVLPVGAGAKDSEGSSVDDSGDSRPVAGSTCGLELAAEAGEPGEELGVLGCTQAASSKTSTVITMPNGTSLSGFNVTPRKQLSRPRRPQERHPVNAQHDQMASEYQGVRYYRAAEPAAVAIHPLRHRAAPWS
jgi:hypothetical protein